MGGEPALTVFAVDKLIAQARKLAADYRRTTGKSLALSGEIAKHDACRLLDLEPVPETVGGYDAIGRGEREGRRVQIKGRAIFDESKSGQRIGQLKTEQDWDSVVLVLMDADFEPVELYEAERDELLEAIEGGRESTRSKRGALSVAKFKAIGRLVWCREEGMVDDEIWDNQTGD